MILHIGNAIKEKDCYEVPYLWLTNKSVHLYLACQKWDKIIIDLSDDIPKDTLKFIVNTGEEIDIRIPDDEKLSRYCMELLCEIYPEKAGLIRKNYMLGKPVI